MSQKVNLTDKTDIIKDSINLYVSKQKNTK